MKRWSIFFFSLVILFTLFYLGNKNPKLSVPATNNSLSASVLYSQRTTTPGLHSTFALASSTEKKLNILIVPGHEPDYGGAEYQNLKERDLTAELSLDLAHYLLQNKHYNVILARTESEWNPDLVKYFATHDADITSFIRDHKMDMVRLVDEGTIKKVANPNPHNDAPDDVAFRLFAINKWANEHDIDIAIHVHFNDNSPRPVNVPGEYNGFTIYVPDHQYANSGSSAEIAKSIFVRLSKMFAVSNLPEESGGVVEDQDLVATGAANTLDAASVLIEYGYIYEPQFKIPSVRAVALKELAFQTYLGLSDFFGDKPLMADSYSSTLLPYDGTAPVVKTESANKEVFSFQAALLDKGLYPPGNLSRNDCPISGLFGSCTRMALNAFQQKFNILGEQGFVGQKTRSQLRALFMPIPSGHNS